MLKAALEAVERQRLFPSAPGTESANFASLAEAYVGVVEALRPFAKLQLSTLYSDAENEGYSIFLGKADFRRQDVLRARAALTKENTDG